MMKKFKTVMKIFAILFCTTLLQIFSAMWFMRDSTAASCLDCPFEQDALYFSLIFGSLLTFSVFILNLIKIKWLKYILEFLIISAVWFFIDWDFFIDRESAWSTYTHTEEIYATLMVSVLPITILGVICIYWLNKILINFKSQN